MPVLIGILLLTAGMLKAHQTATQELLERSILTSRWFVVSLVLFELGLGLWLVSGFHERITRWVGVGTFLVFVERALYLALLDAPSCGCFGRLAVPPWEAILIDLATIGLLLLWRPVGNLTILSHPRWLIGLAFVYLLAAVPLLVTMLSYAPKGAMTHLRNDPKLARMVSLRMKDATLPQVLETLHTATGLTFVIGEGLASQEQHLGEVSTDRAQAWAVLEWIAVRQGSGARWEKTPEGYELVPAVPLGLTFPWVFSGVVLIAGTVAGVVFRSIPASTWFASLPLEEP